MRFAADRKQLVTFISDENVKTIQGYAVLSFEVASFGSFRYKKNHFVVAYIDESIKRKRIKNDITSNRTNDVTTIYISGASY